MELTVHGVVLSAVVVGVVEIAKRTGLPDRFAPLASLVIGVGLALLYLGPDWQTALLTGLALGLMASGLYSGTKAVLLGDEEQRVRARIEWELGQRLTGED